MEEKDNFKYDYLLKKINELEMKLDKFEIEIKKDKDVLYKELLKDCKTYDDFYKHIRYLKNLFYDGECFLTDFKKSLFKYFETEIEKTIRNAKIPFEKI